MFFPHKPIKSSNMAKPKVTRTYGPIHFEDLDPHRFEDLIRELIYDYKEWQSIEATGRSGSDAGFDIRAYEKAEIVLPTDDETDDTDEEIHPMEGNLWMIQGKREKEIGPKKVRKILAEIDPNNLPYGYILAASANFSKKSYDIFRDELRKKGVMEFYIWGKAELEDMLHLPKNDRILFTFFGYSLVSRRKSRTAEIRSFVGIKNKLFRIAGGRREFLQSVLIRDVNDIHYPHFDGYPDFETNPRWKEFIAFLHHPLGLWCHNHKYFAYVDTEKKEWDFTRGVDLLHRRMEDDDERATHFKRRELIEGVWKFFPRMKQGHFEIDKFIQYSSITLIDDKGDALYDFPHIYADFRGKNAPFSDVIYILGVDKQRIRLTEEYRRVSIFPKKFKKGKFGKIHKRKKVLLDPVSLKDFKEYGPIESIYDSDGRYCFLSPKDIISVKDTGKVDCESLIQITYKFKAKIKDYLETVSNGFRIGQQIQQQLGREFDTDEEINIYEFQRISKWELEKEAKPEK